MSNDKPKLLLIGDSFAGMYLPAFQSLAAAHDQEVWFIKDPNRNLYSGVIDLVSSQKPSTVVLAYSWKRALKNGIPELVPPATASSDSAPAGLRGRIAARFGFDPIAMVGDTRSEFRSNLEQLVKTLTDRGIDVWLIDSPPYYPVSVPLKLGLIAKQHGNPDAYGSQLGVHQAEMGYIHDVFKEVSPRARVINVTDVLCDSTKFCRTYANGHSLYSDDAHLSDFGVMQVAPLLNRIFEQSHEVRLSGCRTKPCAE